MKTNKKDILDIAKRYGVEEDYFFKTTFERYSMQLEILNDLKKEINEKDTLIEKEYVKGRKNLYANPAIGNYNKTADSANKTVATLMKIINTVKKDTKISSKSKDIIEDILGDEDD